MPKCAKICIVMVSSICGIASQGIQKIKYNRFHSENQLVKQDANHGNDLVTCFNRLY